MPCVGDMKKILLLPALLCLWGSCDEARGFTLKSPHQGSTVRSGEPVPVLVEVEKRIDLRSIRFFWYRLDEEPLATHQATPASFTRVDPKSPLAGTVVAPVTALGTVRLLVVGEVVEGRLGSHEEFDEILLAAETAAGLQAIEFAAEKPWRQREIGKRITIPAIGQFADGVSRQLAGAGTGSRYHSSDEGVVSVDAVGTLSVKGPGRAQLSVENRGKTGTIDVVIETDHETNRPPIAEVTEELQVKSGSLVVLDGLRSRDPDGDLLRYEWKQLRGHRVALANADEAKATFAAPKVSEPKLFQFSLTVMDMAGPDAVKGAESVPATVSVWVNP